MDKVVDHLLVFEGNGVIKDFPGNYTQYREWKSLKSKEEETAQQNKVANTKVAKKKDYHHDDRRRMSYKEKREYEQLEKEIKALEKEKACIEEALSSGTLSVDEITEKSKRLPLVNDELDEKEMRWLELDELDQ